MINPNVSAALQEARSVCPKNIREIETMEIRQADTPLVHRELEVCFIVHIADDTWSGATNNYHLRFANVVAAMSGIQSDLREKFSSIKWSIVTLDDVANQFPTGIGFLDYVKFKEALDEVTWVPGINNQQGPYFRTIHESVSRLNWSLNKPHVSRHIISLFNLDNNQTFRQPAKDAMVAAGITFNEFVRNFNDAVVLTGGQGLEIIGLSTAALARTNIYNFLIGPIAGELGLGPIFLVNDNEPLLAYLETGQQVLFERRNFGANLFDSGEDGTRTVNISIDNADKEVSKFIARVKEKRVPLEIIFRTYLENDLAGPQNPRPIKLYLSNAVVKGSTLSGQAKWIDIQNAAFPNASYTRNRFPSL